jgi:hypothetical protein
MASPVALRELRAICTTVFASNHSNGAASPWTTAPKVEISAYDDSGLAWPGLPDDTLKTRLYEQDAPTAGLQRGTLKISTRGLGAYANITPHIAAIMMNAAFGGIASPGTNRNVACGSGADTYRIPFTNANTETVPGQAILVGRKGDARGCGEVKPIVACNATHVVLGVACNAAPSQNDPIVLSTTCFVNEDAPQGYIHTLGIGKATTDQRQTLSCAPTVKFSGLGTSERPSMDIELMAADHRRVPASERASLQHATAPQRTSPAFSKGIGLLHFGDYNTTTRAPMKHADLSFDPGVTYAEVPGLGGVNGVEDWQKVKSAPTMTFTLLHDEDTDLGSDFTNGTARHVIAQFGHEMGKTVAFEMAKSYVDADPTPKAAGPLAGQFVTIHGSDDYNSTSNVRSAAFRIHMF